MRMPEKDPQNYTLIGYLLISVAAIWGGVVAHLQHIRKENKPFVWREMIMQVSISGFAGMLTSLLCWYIEAPTPLAGFMAGISGFMGSRALSILEKKYEKVIG